MNQFAAPLASICLAAAVCSGCAALQPAASTRPVGPQTTEPGRTARHGTLVVYTAWDRFDTLDSEHQKHTSYTIRSGNGGKSMRVKNQRGSFGAEPQAVTLQPGTYWVQARATKVGRIGARVVIHPGKTTVIHLDGLAGSRGPEINRACQANGLAAGDGDSPINLW